MSETNVTDASHTPDEYDGPSDRNPTADIFSAERPWGGFQQFVSNEQVTVKIITVQPGHRLSLQKHEHRGEMWTVLDGPMDITVGQRTWVAQPGEVIWAPSAELHRMGALETDEQVDDTMRRIEGSATRMGGLIEDLLTLARLDEGRAMPHESVDLTVLTADAVSDLHAIDPQRPARLLPLGEDASIRSVRVVGNEGQLRQVLANLVGNASRHTQPGQPVELAVGVIDDFGVIVGANLRATE